MTVSSSSNGRHHTIRTIVEDIFIILCIFVLWPDILGWQSPAFTAVKYIALIGLILIFIRRLQAIRGSHPNRGNS